MTKEFSSCGDHAAVTMQANANVPEGMGVEGGYEVVCRDADGNIKWEEKFPNLVVSVGKQLMLDTLLRGSAYTVVGPFLGLTNVTLSPAATDTMTTLVGGGKEFTAYTVGGSAVRGTAVFGASTSSLLVTTSAATAITYTITGGGGTVYGCFLVTGSGAVNTQSNTSGTLYSEGNFGTARTVTVGDTIAVTYSTTATSS